MLLLLFGLRAVALLLLDHLAMALAVPEQVERQVEVQEVLLHSHAALQAVEVEVHLPLVLLLSVQLPPTVTGGEAPSSLPQAAECPPKLDERQLANFRSCPKSDA